MDHIALDEQARAILQAAAVVQAASAKAAAHQQHLQDSIGTQVEHEPVHDLRERQRRLWRRFSPHAVEKGAKVD